MNKKEYYIFVVMVFALLTLSYPVIAQDHSRFSHTIEYKIGGAISIDREIGQACTTGAVKRQTVRGYGEMTKRESIKIAQNIMTVDEISDWIVSDDALRGLSVITTINLCSRPMSTAITEYIDDDNIIEVGDIINPYHPLVVERKIAVSGLTRQLWATSIFTNPGNNGSYHSDFIAAYGPGPYEKIYGEQDRFGNTFFYDDKFLWEFDPQVNYINRDDRLLGYKRGMYYVGNFFNIEQFAHTTDGSLNRFISISSPFEHSILVEELGVVGSASVREAFDMHNLKRGRRAVTLAWYELF